VPELKITIKPQVGSYYIFEPYILHGVPEVTDDSTRYNLVANIKNQIGKLVRKLTRQHQPRSHNIFLSL
jgi:hypothetical protein